MKRVYFYPKIDISVIESPNPYITDQDDAFAQYHERANPNYNKKGVLDFFTHLGKTDIYVLNWIEDLPIYRFGKFQVFFFIFFLWLAHLLNKKIVWVLHNKYSHSRQRNFWTTWMFNILMRHSDLILTHSSEGVDFGKENYPRYAHKIKYLVMPIAPIFPELPLVEKKYDLCIWGTIQPYKGVVELLQFLKDSNNPWQLRLLIVGRCPNAQYKAQLQQNLSEHVVFDDGFYDMDAIRQFVNESKYVLFTYKNYSVLSSSALMDTIRMRTKILGPNLGTFKDFEPLGLLTTYKTFEEIPELVHEFKDISATDQAAIEAFYEAYNWDAFAKILKRETDGLFTAKA